jgi:ABC-type uncharacterized transport system permease subunit
MKYFDITIIGLKQAMVYRTEFFAGLVAALINLTVLWFAWNAVYAASATTVIGGFTLSAMITYLVISSCLKPINYSNIEYDFEKVSERKVSGDSILFSEGIFVFIKNCFDLFLHFCLNFFFQFCFSF